MFHPQNLPVIEMNLLIKHQIGPLLAPWLCCPNVSQIQKSLSMDLGCTAPPLSGADGGEILSQSISHNSRISLPIVGVQLHSLDQCWNLNLDFWPQVLKWSLVATGSILYTGEETAHLALFDGTKSDPLTGVITVHLLLRLGMLQSSNILEPRKASKAASTLDLWSLATRVPYRSCFTWIRSTPLDELVEATNAVAVRFAGVVLGQSSQGLSVQVAALGVELWRPQSDGDSWWIRSEVRSPKCGRTWMFEARLLGVK